jgi:hypothetical protein
MVRHGSNDKVGQVECCKLLWDMEKKYKIFLIKTKPLGRFEM